MPSGIRNKVWGKNLQASLPRKCQKTQGDRWSYQVTQRGEMESWITIFLISFVSVSTHINCLEVEYHKVSLDVIHCSLCSNPFLFDPWVTVNQVGVFRVTNAAGEGLFLRGMFCPQRCHSYFSCLVQCSEERLTLTQITDSANTRKHWKESWSVFTYMISTIMLWWRNVNTTVRLEIRINRYRLSLSNRPRLLCAIMNRFSQACKQSIAL